MTHDTPDRSADLRRIRHRPVGRRLTVAVRGGRAGAPAPGLRDLGLVTLAGLVLILGGSYFAAGGAVRRRAPVPEAVGPAEPGLD
jgi:hypothetical protein